MRIFTLATTFLVLSTGANAALLERLGGLAYYDDVANLTWLADANYAQTSGHDTDGIMTWGDANVWAAGLSVAGVTGWRLPDTLQPDASCDFQHSSYPISTGGNCTGAEMGKLFYNALGNTAGSITNTGPFSNVQVLNRYWLATELAGFPDFGWFFYMHNGHQSYDYKSGGGSSWAVHTGDVGVVPIPAAVWLFGSGLIGLIGLAKRKKA